MRVTDPYIESRREAGASINRSSRRHHQARYCPTPPATKKTRQILFPIHDERQVAVSTSHQSSAADCCPRASLCSLFFLSRSSWSFYPYPCTGSSGGCLPAPPPPLFYGSVSYHSRSDDHGCVSVDVEISLNDSFCRHRTPLEAGRQVGRGGRDRLGRDATTKESSEPYDPPPPACLHTYFPPPY